MFFKSFFYFHFTIFIKKEKCWIWKLFSFFELNGEEKDFNKNSFIFNDSIKIDNCNFSFDEGKNILKGITLEIPKGSWIGIIGESGSGKSTILNLLLKMYEVPNGSIFIDNQDINDVSCFSIRDNITKVSQDIFMFPGTLKENILLINEKASEDEI